MPLPSHLSKSFVRGCTAGIAVTIAIGHIKEMHVNTIGDLYAPTFTP